MVNIRVGRRTEPGSIFIGRPSPLGNPFPLHQEHDRDVICDLYERWLLSQIEKKNPVVLAELARLAKHAKCSGYLVLGCFCAPKRCHGDVIKAVLTKQYAFDQDARLMY